MAQMFEKVVSVISKPPHKRHQREIEALIPWILKKSELMTKLKRDVVIDIIRNCDFVTKYNDDVIIKQGDKGDCFYVILSGIVSIFISNQLADEENLTGTVEEEEVAKEEDEKKEKKKLDRSKFGNYIAKIPAGKSFGELALISKDCVRNASIIADEKTDLLVVNRDLYNRSLKAAQLAEFEEKNSFVSENPLFSNWQAKFKRQMAMSVVKTKVTYDSYIVRQGDPVVGLFFVVSGQAKVIVDPSLHEHQYPNLLPLDDDLPFDFDEDKDDFLHLQPRKKRPDRDRSPLPPDQKLHPSSLQPTPRRLESHGKKIKEICVIGSRDIIGDVELSTELPTYYASVKCIEDCEIFTLDMKNYERLVTRKNPWSIQVMKGNVGIKLHSRIQRLDRTVPLQNALQRKLDEANYLKQKQLEAQNAPTMSREKTTQDFSEFIPHRGPIIDLFGPGTVFYRNRMRERAKKDAKLKSGGFGARGAGFPSWGILGLKAAATVTEAEPPEKPVLEALTEDSSLPQIMKMACLLSDEKDPKIPVNPAFLTETSHVLGRFENTEPDWETSEARLSTLESRIKDWHKLVDRIGPSIVVTVDETDMVALPPAPIRQTTSIEKRVVQLSRYKNDEQKKLAPGKKVYVRRRKKERHRSIQSDGETEHSRKEHSRHKRRTASAEGHTSAQSDTDLETDDENKPSIPKISPSSPNYAKKQHLLMLRKGSNQKQYTVEEYRALKEELRVKTRAFQRFLSRLEAY